MLKKFLVCLTMLCAGAAFSAVEVNKATAAQLDGIKGIGPAMSSKILDERKKGDFKNWNDLVERVKGVGTNSAAKFSAEGLTVNGESLKGGTLAKGADKAAPMALPAPAKPAASATPKK